MAVHNGAAFLQQAIDSVLNQSAEDFEFIIVEDASTDATPSILLTAAASDSRIKLVTNDRNLGLTKSLNIGLGHAVGTYIARMDADDECAPQRFATQLSFLEAHQDHVAVASGFYVIDEAGRRLWKVTGGLDDWQIRWLGGFNPPAPHPTYFFRRAAPDGTPYRYDESFLVGQDMDIWSRISNYGKTAVLSDSLLCYRRHSAAVTVQKRREQADAAFKIGRRNLARRLPPDIVNALEPLLALFAYRSRPNGATIAAAVAGSNAMLAHDLAIAPSRRHRRWLRRMTAALLAEAILSRGGGLKSLPVVLAFIVRARAHLLALVQAVAMQPGLATKSLRATGRLGIREGSIAASSDVRETR